MCLSYFIQKVPCNSQFRCLRFLRWTVLVPLIIYSTLLFVIYNKNVPLKSLTSPSTDRDKGGVLIESLFDELEAVTPRKNSLEKEKKAESYENPRTLLKDIFQRADIDKNQLLDIQELAKSIYVKTIEHITRAMRENIGLFTVIDDNPKNGEVSWEEYHAYFLRSRGFPESYVNSHDKKHSDMSRALKEYIMRDRAQWSEAARNDPERLTLDEFLAFIHPECSHRVLLQTVEDLFQKFDQNDDEQLTEDEFSDLPSEGMALDLWKDKQKIVTGSEDRRKEFRHLVDKNKNGKADRAELLMYIDPRNPRHAIQEAQRLINLSDTNLDGKLSLSEILHNMDLFLGSKMVGSDGSFHDEF